MNQTDRDKILAELFDQIIAYEKTHHDMMCFTKELECASMLRGQVSGMIQGLRIAVCVVNDWEIDSSDEGTADQAVREYAEKHCPEGFE